VTPVPAFALVVAASLVGGAASIALGVAFIVAGASKLAAGARWRAQAADLGVPAPIAVGVPWLELAVGSCLVTRLAEPVPAIVAGVMLVAFTTLLVLRLRDGSRPPCACFGAWSSGPLSWMHVARNVGLLVFAAVALAA
jgi:hypothetical protein